MLFYDGDHGDDENDDDDDVDDDGDGDDDILSFWSFMVIHHVETPIMVNQFMICPVSPLFELQWMF